MAPIVAFRTQLTLGIVAGGKARRLGGVPKGLLRYQGRTLLERLLELKPLFAEVLLGANDPAPYAGFGLRTVADQVVDRGSPGGVHALLACARTEWVVAVAADMPFVTPAAVGVLLGKLEDSTDLVCFRVGGRLEPLLAVYRASLAPAWERALEAQPSFAQLFASFRATVLPQEALGAVDPTFRSVLSVNTPEEAARLGIELP